MRDRRRPEWTGSGHRSCPSWTEVHVLEAESTPGGAARTLELTLPGFRHDFGSAVYPLGAGSPFFSSLPLSNHGLEWIHSPAALAHPLDDGTAVMLQRDLDETRDSLGIDGPAWDQLVRRFAESWTGVCFGSTAPRSLYSTASIADGSVWDDRVAVGASCRSPVPSGTNPGTVCGFGRPLFPQPGRTVERSVRNPDGSAGACRWLADTSRRRSITHRCTVQLSLDAWWEGENFIAGPEFGGIGERISKL